MSRQCQSCSPCPPSPPTSPLPQPTGPFDVVELSQFVFIVDDKLATCIYRDIAGPDQDVSLLARFQLRLKDCKTLIKIIPGNVINLGQTCEELARVNSVLLKYCVPFENRTVLSVSGPVGAGDAVPALIQNLLFCRLVIQELYLAKNGRIILDVSDLALAKRILENAQDPTIAPLCQPCCNAPCFPCVPKPCVRRCKPERSKKCKKEKKCGSD